MIYELFLVPGAVWVPTSTHFSMGFLYLLSLSSMPSTYEGSRLSISETSSGLQTRPQLFPHKKTK